MSAAAVIAVEGVSKRFARRGARPATLKELIRHPRRRLRSTDLWALRDVSLSLAAGESIGLIGANGSGKSTLLRLVGGLGRPTAGQIVRRRPVEAILSLSDGFDPYLTGRENAVAAGILSGLRRREIVARLDEVVAFAELEEFFDRPLQTYSEGMKLRLAFSASLCVAPEVLLLDEVLSVGDLRFQEKCFARLAQMRQEGTALLFASHDEEHVLRLCDRVVWLSHGEVVQEGAPEAVLEAYREAMRFGPADASGAPVPLAVRADAERFGTFEVEVEEVRVAPKVVQAGARGQLRIEVDLRPRAPVDDPIVVVTLHRADTSLKVLEVNTASDGAGLGRLSEPRTVSLLLERLDVEPGEYRLAVGVFDPTWETVFDYHWDAFALEVADAGAGFGPARRWTSS